MLQMILLAIGSVIIVGVVLYFFIFNERTNTFQRFRHTEKKHPESVIDTGFFSEGLQNIGMQHPDLVALHQEIHKKIIGMDAFINAIIINMLCGGHMLIEGVPGLAKTKTVHTFADILGMDFKRIQFTPDMLPADILGVEMYDNATKSFEAKLGPIMTNIILADEINRATPKVQSALLEAMQEQQVTIGGKSFKLPDPFFVLATQNPLEQEGTYPLPEAQIDRFLFKILVSYPNLHEEKKILDGMERDQNIQVKKIISHKEFYALKQGVQEVIMADQIKQYITKLIEATRICEQLAYGSSPRGSIGLMNASKAVAFCEGRDYVTHDDVQKVALTVLRHRVILSYEAKMEGLHEDQVLLELFKTVKLA